MIKKLFKYFKPVTLMSVMTTFLLFFLAYPHLVLSAKFLSFVYAFLVMIPLLGLFIYKLVLLKKNEERLSFYDTSFLLIFFLTITLFFTSLSSFTALLAGNRAFLGVLFLVAVILTYILLLLLLLLDVKIIPTPLLAEEESREKSQKALAREAKMKRLVTKSETLYFYLGVVALLGLFFFSFALVQEQFTIPLGGDYTQQQIPFYTNGYDDWWKFIKTGEFPLWDANTFLGASNIGSNSFYYSMNPFFLPILLFPRELIPQGLAILMIGKFVLASVTMRAYLKYMGVNEVNARIFSIVYAFCGWNAYYLWFNHFMEVAVIFPLIFLGIEKTLKEKKIVTLIAGLALMGFANYFFLVTVGLIGVMYAVYRYFALLPTIKGKDKLYVILLGFTGFALGVLASSVVLFPSLTIALNSDRVTNASYLDNLKLAFNLKDYKLVWEIMTKWEYQSESYSHKGWYPLISFYFPVLSDRSSPLLNTSSYDNTISSIYAFSSVIFLFIPSLYNNLMKKKFSHLIPIAFFLFALFTPFFYNLFHGFSKEYGRWQLIVSFLLITYVALNIEEVKTLPKYVFDLSFIVNIILMGVTVAAAYSYQNKNGFSLMYEREYVIYYAFFMFFLTYLYYRHKSTSKSEPLFRFSVLAFEIVVMGTITMIGHGFISYKGSVSGGQQSYKEDMAAISKIKESDDSYYRIYNTRAYKGNDNLPMRENYNGLSAFHSLYNFNLMTFNNWSRINYNYNGWSLGIHERRVFLDDFLNVKYYIVDDNSHAIRWTDGSKTVAPYLNVPNTFEYKEVLSTPTRSVFKQKESFNVGFGVDDIVSYEAFENDELVDVIASRGRYASPEHEELYLNAGILNYEDHAEIATSFPHLANKTIYNITKNSSTKYYGHVGLVKRRVLSCNVRYPYTGRAGNENARIPSEEYVNSICEEYVTTPTTINGSNGAIEYTLRSGANFLDEAGSIIFNLPFAYSSGSYNYSYNYNIFLYDENDDLITFDNHKNPTSASRTWKVMRGLNSPKKVKKITLIPIGTQTVPEETGIYVYSQSLINTIREKSITNSLENIKVTTNTVSFSTNYDNNKYIVTTIPYDKGWSVKTEAGKDIPVYQTQGGFVGFVSEVGNTNYKLSFVPEYFNLGLLLSTSSLLVMSAIALTPIIVKKIKEHKQSKKEEIEQEETNAE